jgi:isoquinoline 1-oxidoreductase alpha subunit
MPAGRALPRRAGTGKVRVLFRTLGSRGRFMATLTVNGKRVEVDADASTPLLWVLREQLGLTGTKYSCGIGVCGSCTVHIDGEAVRACTMPVSGINESQEILTIEGLSADSDHPVQQAWAELDVPQCGYCQPGMIMTAAALLAENPDPSDADIDAAMTNICRCGTFNRVRHGIHLAAEIKRKGEPS